MTYNCETIAFRVFLLNMLFRYFIFSYKMVHSWSSVALAKQVIATSLFVAQFKNENVSNFFESITV